MTKGKTMSEQENHPDIDLMRNSLQATLTNHVPCYLNTEKQAHIGLLLQRGLRRYDGKSDKPTKNKLIEQIACCNGELKIYKDAFSRWLYMTSDTSRYSFTTAKIVGRLYTGLSSATALETGLTTHHTYGMPMLAGSSVKGAVAAYAEQIGLKEKNIDVYRVLFGDEDHSGAVIWHDAWWIPNSGKPFVEEIVTTHHQEYYRGKDKNNNPKILPDELEDPNPNQQIGCEGSFYFVVEAVNQAWATFATNLLLQMLENQGMGSKTASGYGYFQYDKKSNERIAQSQVDENDLTGQLNLFDENKLLESLSRNLNKFLSQFELEKTDKTAMKNLVETILANEKLAGYIESWRSQTNEKNKAKAVKFIDENK